MAGVGVLCFAASYAIAFVAELLVNRVRHRFCVVFVFAWTVAGWVAHSAFLVYTQAVLRIAISGAQSFCYVTAWGLVLLLLYLNLFYRRLPASLVIWPAVFALIGAGFFATNFPNFQAQVDSNTVSVWIILHPCLFFFTTLSVSTGFLFGLLYLLQDRRLRRHQPLTLYYRLPSLEGSATVCRKSLGASIFLLAACIFSGFLLEIQVQSEQGSDFAVPWSDPLIIGSLLLFSFLLLFSGLLRQAFFSSESRRIVWLTLAAFAFLLVIFVLALSVRNTHWNRQSLSAHSSATNVSSVSILERKGSPNIFREAFL